TAVTVGDIYQHLVPYRTVRAELGFGELAEYEHALLRLLPGERRFLVVGRADVQEEVQRELPNTNPILGVSRDYADVGVYLNPYAPDPVALDLTAPPPPPPPPPAPAALPEGAADAAGVASAVTRPDPPAKPPRKLKACTGCRSTLPPGR